MFSHGVSEEDFWQLVLIELGLYTALWSQVSASGFFLQAELWSLEVWAVQDVPAGREWSAPPSSPDPGLEQSKRSVPGTHATLSAARLPTQASPPCFRAFICGPRRVRSHPSPPLRAPRRARDDRQPPSDLSRDAHTTPVCPLVPCVPLQTPGWTQWAVSGQKISFSPILAPVLRTFASMSFW